MLYSMARESRARARPNAAGRVSRAAHFARPAPPPGPPAPLPPRGVRPGPPGCRRSTAASAPTRRSALSSTRSQVHARSGQSWRSPRLPTAAPCAPPSSLRARARRLWPGRGIGREHGVRSAPVARAPRSATARSPHTPRATGTSRAAAHLAARAPRPEYVPRRVTRRVPAVDLGRCRKPMRAGHGCHPSRSPARDARVAPASGAAPFAPRPHGECLASPGPW